MNMDKVLSLYHRGVRDFPTMCDKIGRVDDLFEFNRLAKEGYSLQEIARYFGIVLAHPIDKLMQKQFTRITEGDNESKVL